MEKLVLKNGEEIQIESGSSIANLIMVFRTKADMVAVWNLLTEENLKSIQIKNSDNVVIGEYDNLVLENEVSTLRGDGTVITSFNFRQKTELELLKEEMEILKIGQEVQDGAIVELAGIIGG